MWGFDPELREQLGYIRDMVKRSHQNPTREWPLVAVHEFNVLLVVREWQGGGLTAYTMSTVSNNSRKSD